MKSYDVLFHLIHSLDGNEKRYFQLFSSLQGGDKRYLLVFNALRKQREYDEQKARGVLGKSCSARRFSGIKHYLFNLIVNSLEQYHTNIKTELYRELHRIEILYKKEFYTLCRKLVEKAKRKAIKYDLQLPLLELVQWEYKLIEQPFIGANEDKIINIFASMSNSIEQYKASYELLWNAYLFIYSAKLDRLHPSRRRRRVFYTNDESDDDAVLLPSQKGWKGMGDSSLSFHALSRLYEVQGAYFSLQHYHEDAYVVLSKLLQLMEKNPHQIAENPLSYMQVIEHLFSRNLAMRRYGECANLIGKGEGLQRKFPKIKKDIDFLMKEMKLLVCIETGAFDKGVALVRSAGEKWEKADSIVNKEQVLLFQYNTAYLYFGNGNYRKANEYLNKILNEPEDAESDIRGRAQLLSLLVLFELGNRDLLKYRIRAVHRFLYSRKNLYKEELIILEFIRKVMPKIYSAVETQYVASLQKSFGVLLKKLKLLSSKTVEQKAFGSFDFISWLESKVEGRTFAEVVREKVKKRIGD